tara:strand:+ start:669 stop:1067 length:399 start_codon:yes stop_codon:yes gene_type:complete
MKSRQSKKVINKSKYPKYTAKKKPVFGDPIFKNKDHYLEALKEWRRKRELNNISVRKCRERRLENEKQLINTVNHYKTLYEEIREQLDDLIQYQHKPEFNQHIKQEPVEGYENYDNHFNVNFDGDGDVDIIF